MATINPYIHFNSNAEEAFNFYKSVFGGEFSNIMRFKDMAGNPAAADEPDAILHIALPIGNGSVLMGSDTPKMLGRQNERENRSKIAVSTDSRAEADKIFNGLSAGGEVEMPMADAPWGAYFGMFRDKYGIEWMINCDAKG